jgi:hypothetical protein
MNTPEPAWWSSALNRRATVEQWMFDAARGKRPMPTPEELRAWAIKLGTPEPGEPALTDGVAAVHPAQPAAWVPIHPRNGPLWSMTTDTPSAERLPGSYPLRPLVFADGVDVPRPPTTQEDRFLHAAAKAGSTLVAPGKLAEKCDFPVCAVHHICTRNCERTAGVKEVDRG